jgi:hypothetical protein
MSTEQYNFKTAMEMLHEKLLIAFHEARENGLQWLDCEATAESANAEVFPDADIEAERKGRARVLNFARRGGVPAYFYAATDLRSSFTTRSLCSSSAILASKSLRDMLAASEESSCLTFNVLCSPQRSGL